MRKSPKLLSTENLEIGPARVATTIITTSACNVRGAVLLRRVALLLMAEPNREATGTLEIGIARPAAITTTPQE